MKGCLKKNLMKKPAAARKKKKRSASMKMHKVMKKKVGRQKIIKRPAMLKKAWRENTWKVADGHERGRLRTLKKKENVQARARKAARNGLPYQTKWPEYGDVAAAAYAAEVKSIKAMERADSAHEAADEAKEEAADARLVAGEARSVARLVAEEAFQNNYSKRITSLEEELETGLETLAETAARAKRNEERLNTDDRKRGYLTPRMKKH